jgi:hypothetical protein
MDIKTHTDFVEDGYRYFAERQIPFSTDTRRVYIKDDNLPIYVNELTGVKVTRTTMYESHQRDAALRHCQDGLVS